MRCGARTTEPSIAPNDENLCNATPICLMPSRAAPRPVHHRRRRIKRADFRAVRSLYGPRRNSSARSTAKRAGISARIEPHSTGSSVTDWVSGAKEVRWRDRCFPDSTQVLPGGRLRMRTNQPKRTGSQYFHLLDPLNPPTAESRHGQLSTYVTEAASWFFGTPDRNQSAGSERGPRSAAQIAEAIDLALCIVRDRSPQQGRSPAAPRLASSRGEPTSRVYRSGKLAHAPRANLAASHEPMGISLVNFFCDRFIRRQKPWRAVLSDGREIGQRELLCALALHRCEEAAQGSN